VDADGVGYPFEINVEAKQTGASAPGNGSDQAIDHSRAVGRV